MVAEFAEAFSRNFTIKLAGEQATLIETTKPGGVELMVDHQTQFDAHTPDSIPQEQQDFYLAKWSRVQAYSGWLNGNAPYLKPIALDYEDTVAIKPGWPNYGDLEQYILEAFASPPDNYVKLFINFQCSGGTCPQYYADPGMQGWRDYIVSQVEAISADGYRGAWLDDINLVRYSGEWPITPGDTSFARPFNPATGTAYTNEDWDANMDTLIWEVFRDVGHLELVGNLYWGSPITSRMDSIIINLDYVNIERGFLDAGLNWGGGNFGFDTMLAYIDHIHQLGRKVILDPHRTLVGTGEVYQLTDDEIDYCIATYLLVKEPGDLLCLEDDLRVTFANWDSRLDVDLGNPTSAIIKNGNVYARAFQNGFVRVDLSASPDIATGSVLNWRGLVRTYAPDAILRFPAAADEGATGGTVAYRLRWTPDIGDKVWTEADLALPFVEFRPEDLDIEAEKAGMIGWYKTDLRMWPELAGISGVYDVLLTTVDAAGNDSIEKGSYQEVENATFNF